MTSNELFKRFTNLNYSKSMIGLEYSNETECNYFCTPKEASIIGMTGVDGIHFCFIPLISQDIVFVVSPIPCSERFVVPVARNFRDFLSFLFYCKDTSLIELISYTEEHIFNELVQEERSKQWIEQEIVLKAIKDEFKVEERSDVYEAVRRFQQEFDYETIPFTSLYNKTMGI